MCCTKKLKTFLMMASKGSWSIQACSKWPCSWCRVSTGIWEQDNACWNIIMDVLH